MRPGQWEPHVALPPRRRADHLRAQQGETLVWDARAGRIVRRYPIGGRFGVSPDGRRLAVALNNYRRGLDDSKIALLDLRSGRHTVLLERLAWEWIVSLTFTADGTRVIGEGAEGAHVWDLRSGRIAETYGVPKSAALGRARARSPGPGHGRAHRRRHQRVGCRRRPPLGKAVRLDTRRLRLRRVPVHGRRPPGCGHRGEHRRRHGRAGRPAHQAPDRAPAGSRRDLRGGDRLHGRRAAARHRRERGQRHDPGRPVAGDRPPVALPRPGGRRGGLARRPPARRRAPGRRGQQRTGRAARPAVVVAGPHPPAPLCRGPRPRRPPRPRVHGRRAAARGPGLLQRRLDRARLGHAHGREAPRGPRSRAPACHRARPWAPG